MTDHGAGQGEDIDLEAELERRLTLLTAPDFADPAREPFVFRDFVLIALFVLLSCIVAWLILP